VRVFDDIYRRRAWGEEQSASGPGSGEPATRLVGPAIVMLVEELGASSVLEVGCGDGYWMPDLPGYVGIDVSAEAIKLASKRHPRREYRVATLDELDLGAFDLVIVRDVIQHLPSVEGVRILSAITDRWLLASTFVGGTNVEIAPGDAYSPDLTAPPFDMPEPDRLIFDGYGYFEPTYRDVRKFLGLWAR
jgi:SAM-dependent methyltransferase